MTPLAIDILMHYHCRADDYPHLSPPAQQKLIDYFLSDDYLVNNSVANRAREHPKYLPTDKLHFYCEALCAMPEPVQKWVIEGVDNGH